MASTDPVRHESRFSYPVFLDLDGALVLVVGGGRVAARKVSGLAAAGARVRVVAPELDDAIDRRSIAEVHQRPFRSDDLDGVRLVVTATGDATVDADVAREARHRGIWTNAADRPADCDAILPAIARSGRVTCAVSTDGASPALAGWLRDEIVAHWTERFGDALAGVAEELARRRAEVRGAGGSTEDLDWRGRIEEALLGDR